jgi:hypothetical protein
LSKQAGPSAQCPICIDGPLDDGSPTPLYPGIPPFLMSDSSSSRRKEEKYHMMI